MNKYINIAKNMACELIRKCKRKQGFALPLPWSVKIQL